MGKARLLKIQGLKRKHSFFFCDSFNRARVWEFCQLQKSSGDGRYRNSRRRAV